MNNCLEICNSDRLPKGLTVVMLFFSMFLLSGNGVSTQPSWQEPAKTELVVSLKRLAGRYAFSYEQALMSGFISRFSFLPIVKAFALLDYNRLIITKTARIFRAGLPARQHVLLPVKTIPQSSDEHFLNS